MYKTLPGKRQELTFILDSASLPRSVLCAAAHRPMRPVSNQTAVFLGCHAVGYGGNEEVCGFSFVNGLVRLKGWTELFLLPPCGIMRLDRGGDTHCCNDDDGHDGIELRWHASVLSSFAARDIPPLLLLLLCSGCSVWRAFNSFSHRISLLRDSTQWRYLVNKSPVKERICQVR